MVAWSSHPYKHLPQLFQSDCMFWYFLIVFSLTLLVTYLFFRQLYLITIPNFSSFNQPSTPPSPHVSGLMLDWRVTSWVFLSAGRFSLRVSVQITRVHVRLHLTQTCRTITWRNTCIKSWWSGIWVWGKPASSSATCTRTSHQTTARRSAWISRSKFWTSSRRPSDCSSGTSPVIFNFI